MLRHWILSIGMCVWMLFFLNYYLKLVIFFRKRRNFVLFLINWLIVLVFFLGSLYLDNYLSKKFCGESEPSSFTAIWVATAFVFIIFKARALALK
jgi:hypothetical protein